MKAKYFKIEELVPKQILELGEDLCWSFIDSRLIESLDAIREHFNKPVIVNNWSTGGKFSQRCLRTSESVGVKWSQHRFGRAADFDVVGMTAAQVRKEILANTYKFPYIQVMEDDVNWVHIDVRNTQSKDGIILFKP